MYIKCLSKEYRIANSRNCSTQTLFLMVFKCFFHHRFARFAELCQCLNEQGFQKKPFKAYKWRFFLFLNQGKKQVKKNLPYFIFYPQSYLAEFYPIPAGFYNNLHTTCRYGLLRPFPPARPRAIHPFLVYAWHCAAFYQKSCPPSNRVCQ